MKEPSRPRSPSTPAEITGTKQAAAKKTVDPFKRLYGSPLHYLEEREWRVIFHSATAKYFTPGPQGDERPDHFLKFVTGRDLFTLVLPDNRTVHMALSDEEIKSKLYPEDAPHVTVLSLEDVGTF